jgi:transcription antitermination factor NusG
MNFVSEGASMSTHKSISALASPSLRPVLAAREAAPQWYAVYTAARHEKRVREHLERRGIESFLPLYRSQRQWNNGCNVLVELPVFPNYLFVHIEPEGRVRVLEVSGVLSLVGSGREPAPLPEFEIESLRTALDQRKFEPHPYLVAGERVRICPGALAGMEGVLLRKKSCWRVVLALDLIMKSVAVEVEASEIEPCPPRSWHSARAQ